MNKKKALIILFYFIILIFCYFNYVNNLSIIKNNTQKIEKLNDDVNIIAIKHDVKNNKIYDDGINILNRYEKFNTNQLNFIIDHISNDDSLKKKFNNYNEIRYNNIIEDINNIKELNKSNIIDTIDNDIYISIQDYNLKRYNYINDGDTIKPRVSIFNKKDSKKKIYYITNIAKDYYELLKIHNFNIIEKNESELDNNLYNIIYEEK